MLRRILPIAVLIAVIASMLLAIPAHGVEDPLSLAIEFTKSDKPISGCQFSVYRIGDMDPAGKITLDSGYAKWSGISDASDRKLWAKVAREMAEQVSKTKSKPLASRLTDAEGRAVFGNGTLSRGAYLVVGGDFKMSGKTWTSNPFIVTIPSWNSETGTWEYQVEAYPKPGKKAEDVPENKNTDKPSGDRSPKLGDTEKALSLVLGIALLATAVSIIARRRADKAARDM